MSLSNHSSPISLSNPLKTSESRGKNFISSHLPPEKKERRGEKKDDTKQRPIATDTMALVKSTISVDVSPRLISNVNERDKDRERERKRERDTKRERTEGSVEKRACDITHRSAFAQACFPVVWQPEQILPVPPCIGRDRDTIPTGDAGGVRRDTPSSGIVDRRPPSPDPDWWFK